MDKDEKDKCVVLLSGGLDSAVCLAVAAKSYKCYPMTFDYGQRHRGELSRAQVVANSILGYKEPHYVCPVSLSGGSLLSDELPETEMTEGIPSTWVPARNLVFLALAANYAVRIGAKIIVIGVNSIDFSGYPDCRPSFIEAAQKVLNEALDRHITIHAPLLKLSKAAIIRLGHDLEVDFSKTCSCYNPSEKGACGVCQSCRIRLLGFEKAGLKDPIQYVEESK